MYQQTISGIRVHHKDSDCIPTHFQKRHLSPLAGAIHEVTGGEISLLLKQIFHLLFGRKQLFLSMKYEVLSSQYINIKFNRFLKHIVYFICL